ncbi:MAG: hypothetical protein JWO44_1263 [Bacteroidetes bacterium]|nr:hypothetical protein [Bacteroidota bacterium]
MSAENAANPNWHFTGIKLASKKSACKSEKTGNSIRNFPDYSYFCGGVSLIQPAPFNPPGAEASKGNRS